jgi:hypothetical protein
MRCSAGQWHTLRIAGEHANRRVSEFAEFFVHYIVGLMTRSGWLRQSASAVRCHQYIYINSTGHSLLI